MRAVPAARQERKGKEARRALLWPFILALHCIIASSSSMGTCVSKCYPDDSTSKPPAPAKEATVAAHPPPLPLEGAASPSPTTTTTTCSLSLASTSNSSSSSSSSRGLVLLPSSSSSKSKISSREWDVVVLDPKSYYHHCSCSKLNSSVHHSHSGTMPKAKRARSVSPLPTTTRRAPNRQQQHKRRKPAAEREALLVRRSTEPSRYNKTPSTRIVEDDLTNPVIAMDCFIFL